MSDSAGQDCHGCISRTSPVAVPVEETVPAGNSSTQRAFLIIPETLHGFIPSQIWITLFSESIKTASIGNLIKNICMELHGARSRPWPGGSSFLNWSPLSLARKVEAVLQLAASTVLRVTFVTVMLSPRGKRQSGDTSQFLSAGGHFYR